MITVKMSFETRLFVNIKCGHPVNFGNFAIKNITLPVEKKKIGVAVQKKKQVVLAACGCREDKHHIS